MERVKQYIQKHIRYCSNSYWNKNDGDSNYPWLTPGDARKIAEIAREETVKEVCEWIRKNVYSYTWYDFQQYEIGVETGKLIEDLKKHLIQQTD